MAKSANNPPRFTTPTIEERERTYPPKRGASDRRARISHPERASILVRHLRDVSPPRIGRELGIGASTVREAITDIHRCPSLLLRMELYVLAKAGSKDWYKCLICGTVRPGSNNAALRHVLNEVFPQYPDRFRDPSNLSHEKEQEYLTLVRRLPRQIRDGRSVLGQLDALNLLMEHGVPIPIPRDY